VELDQQAVKGGLRRLGVGHVLHDCAIVGAINLFLARPGGNVEAELPQPPSFTGVEVSGRHAGV
jgi:hypothetical protein